MSKKPFFIETDNENFYDGIQFFTSVDLNNELPDIIPPLMKKFKPLGYSMKCYVLYLAE